MHSFCSLPLLVLGSLLHPAFALPHDELSRFPGAPFRTFLQRPGSLTCNDLSHFLPPPFALFAISSPSPWLVFLFSPYSTEGLAQCRTTLTVLTSGYLYSTHTTVVTLAFPRPVYCLVSTSLSHHVNSPRAQPVEPWIHSGSSPLFPLCVPLFTTNFVSKLGGGNLR